MPEVVCPRRNCALEGSVTPEPGPTSTPGRVPPRRDPPGRDVIFIDLTRDDDGSASESSTPRREGTPIDLTQDDDEPAPGARKRKFGSPGLDARDQGDGCSGSSPQKWKRRAVAPCQASKTALEVVEPPVSPAYSSTPSVGPPSSSPLRPKDNSPLAIHARYVAARDAWFESQPPHARTDRRYREAAGLPLQYGKSQFDWCRNWKQMTARCNASTGSRDWTTEEMMAYLDWDRAEDERVQAIVESRINKIRVQRGTANIWEMVESDRG